LNINQLQLVAKIRKGDAGAFTVLFKKFQPDMFRFLWHLTRSEEASHDIIQDIFLKIWRNQKTWNPKSDLKAYLLRASKNAALNYLDRDKTNLRRFESLTETIHGDTIPDTDYEKKERHRIIKQAVDSLPKICRTVFVLSRYEDLKYQKIAKVLDISVKTVENHMRRALILLREKLGEVLKD